MEKTHKRGSFTGSLGFILAAAGSSVGLGNIWRFPYLAAKDGGGLFLLVYLVLALTFGFALLITEIAIGRKTGQSPLTAYGMIHKKMGWVGVLACLVPLIILPYYSVIGGWVTKYAALYVTGGGASASKDGFFSAFAAEPIEPLTWFALFILLTALIVLFGVEKGIERVSCVLMPVLVILTVGISVYALTQEGALEGALYYLRPDFSSFGVETVLAAMGQLFYSMSLAMGIMVTYGSYMKKDISIVSSARQIGIFDTGIAFFAGLMIIPAVFSFSGGDASALNQGPSLMFVTLPRVFDSMPFGHAVGAVFFLLVFLAALTSSISMMETIVSIIRDKFHISRRLACLTVLLFSLLLGVPSSLGNGLLDSVRILGLPILDFFDFISNSVLMPIVALLTAVFVGYVIKTKTLSDEIEISAPFREKPLFHVVIRYVAPILILLILVSSVLNTFGVITI